MKRRSKREKIVEECWDSIITYFEFNYYKAILWFNTKNPALGGVAPFEMIICGRSDKLKKFIDNALEGITP